MINFASRSRSLRILCVEEDVVERKLLQACMEAAQVEAVFARNATEALDYFAHHPMDMVFMDIDRHPPGELGGFRRMRATPRRWHSVPILAMTDNDCHWAEATYREAGFAGVFFKPIEPSRLFIAIDDVLHEYHQPPLLAERRAAVSIAQVA